MRCKAGPTAILFRAASEEQSTTCLTEIRLGYAGAAKEGVVTCMQGWSGTGGLSRFRLNIKLAAARAALLSSARKFLFQPRSWWDAKWLESRVSNFASHKVQIGMIGCLGGCERICCATVCATWCWCW